MHPRSRSLGTGKTTFAKLYGRLLKELGFLSNGEVVAKTASDFVGSHVGESQNNTKAILESAQGKVLIIDEAYALDDDLYGKQVLDTLVEKVQGTPSDDMAVLLVGYEQQMLRMVKRQNPGILRRFPEAHALYFDDYTEDELLEILALYLAKQGVTATLEFREKALDVLRIQKKQANFGNAGSVENLIKGAALKAAKRDKLSADLVLYHHDIEDAGENRSEKEIDPLEKLHKLFRVGDINDFGSPSAIVHFLQVGHLLIAENRVWQGQTVTLLVTGIQQVTFRPDVAFQRHDDFFANRIDWRVGHLSEQLAEIVIQHSRLIAETRQRGIVAHRTNRVLLSMQQGNQHKLQGFGGIPEGLHAVQQVLVFVILRLCASGNISKQNAFLIQPLAIGATRRHV